MIPYFEDKIICNRLLVEAKEWLGTPYRHLGNYKGRGADCTLFLGNIFINIGVLSKLDYEWYPVDWFVHEGTEKILESFLTNSNNLNPALSFTTYGDLLLGEGHPPILFGDILTFTTCVTKITNHASIYLGNETMIHAVPKEGVIISQYGVWWEKKLTNIIRIFKRD